MGACGRWGGGDGASGRWWGPAASHGRGFRQRRQSQRCLERPGFRLAGRWGTLEGGLPWQSWAHLPRARVTPQAPTSERMLKNSQWLGCREGFALTGGCRDLVQTCAPGEMGSDLTDRVRPQFSHSVVSHSVTPWTAARQASLSITNSQSLLRFMSIELVMPSNHLILYHPLLLLPSIFPSISSVQSLSCVRLFDPMNRSTSGFPVHHQLPESTETHVH